MNKEAKERKDLVKIAKFAVGSVVADSVTVHGVLNRAFDAGLKKISITIVITRKEDTPKVSSKPKQTRRPTKKNSSK
ncbi:MAG TPA: hypothetical protein VIJ29_03885 [Candidatus Paceibacterota bacterium]